MVNSALSNAGGVGLIPGQGVKIPHALGAKKNPKHKTINVVTNSIKTLEMVHIKINLKKKKKQPKA